jgi:hypothetical protein
MQAEPVVVDDDDLPKSSVWVLINIFNMSLKRGIE